MKRCHHALVCSLLLLGSSAPSLAWAPFERKAAYEEVAQVLDQAIPSILAFIDQTWPK